MKSRAHILAIAVTLAAGLAHAHGDDGHAAPRQFDPAQVETMRFDPASLTVRKGETVRFVVANHGAVLHEMVLGTREALKEHAAMMQKHPGMEHDEPSIAHVKPGGTGEIVWQFTQAGEFQFACLVPGHFEAGMIGKVVVK